MGLYCHAMTEEQSASFETHRGWHSCNKHAGSVRQGLQYIDDLLSILKAMAKLLAHPHGNARIPLGVRADHSCVL